jgi:long-chain acyl-CoA synthetase
MIMLTSGTTGTPKGCLVSHGSYLYRCLSYAVEFKMGPEDREVVAIPLCLGAGRGSTFACLALWGSVVLEPKFDPKRFLTLLTREQVTTFSLVPTAYQSLVDAVSSEAFDGRGLLSMKTVGSSMPMALRQEVQKKLSRNLFQTYASVDTGIIAILRPDEMEEEPTLVGRPIWGMEAKVVDEKGQELETGEMGEIACRGPLVSQGYFRNPEATSASFQGGWFRTGDLGSLDEKGRLYLRGRKKNLIKSGGRSIFPDEIEAVLQAHPQVQEAAVFGVPDPKWGEAVHAAVVPKAGETLFAEDLLEFCRGQLAGYKCPKRIHLMRELPRGNLGKVSIEGLRKQVGLPP